MWGTFFNRPVVFGSKMTFPKVASILEKGKYCLYSHRHTNLQQGAFDLEDWGSIWRELFCQKIARWHDCHHHMTTRTGWQDDSRSAVSHVEDISPVHHTSYQKIILEETHFEGFKNYGDSWKSMDEVDLHAFIGLLILAGVYRSGGEAASRLWDAERQFLLFLAIIDLILIPFPFLFLHSKG